MRHCFSNTLLSLICAGPIHSTPRTILHPLVGSLWPGPGWNFTLLFCVPVLGTGFLQQRNGDIVTFREAVMRLTGGHPLTPCARHGCAARSRRDGRLNQRCHRGALPCSGVTTTIPQTCLSMIDSWGFGAVPSFDSAPRGLLHCVVPGAALHIIV